MSELPSPSPAGALCRPTKQGARRLAAAFALGLVLAAAAESEEHREDDDDPLRERREAFLEAYEAARAGAPAGVEADDAPLRGYPLYRYVESARIGHSLSSAENGWSTADARARAFLERHAGEAVAWPLRQAWLASLARRGEWQAFLDEYRPEIATERLECQYLAARIEVGALSGLAPAIIEQWLTPAQLPIECEPVFQWLRAEGPLTDALVERRVRALLDRGRVPFARVIAGRLPESRAAPLLRWADLIEQPARSIDASIAAPERPVATRALLDGWSRLSRDRPGAALERYEALLERRDLEPADRSRFALALALGLAWDRRPEALELFDRVAPADLDDYALGWLARAALWAGDWPRVQQAIDDMSGAARGRSAWRYWAARAAEQLGERARARQLYESLLGDDNYYSAMAAARRGRGVTPNQAALPRDDGVLRAVARRPPFVRARELFRAGLRVQAMREWQTGYAELAPDARLQSIRLAAEWAWYDLTVVTATELAVYNDYRLLYPRPHDDAVSSAAALAGLDRPLVHALVRQESLYRSRSVSEAGAMGLTQLLPATARRAARRWRQPAPQRADLFVPAVNLTLGAAHLRSLVDDLGGQLPVALAAYNAGRGAAERWLPDRPIDADVWIENIPYNETRAYARRVLWHSLVFKWLETGRRQRTDSWLDPVAPPVRSDG